MDALFIFRSLRQLFGRSTAKRQRGNPAAREGASSVFPPAAVVPPRADVQPAPRVAAPKLRTLEEVRADLARLRLSSRERHAQSQAWRDTNFAPTDFMDLANN
jgi:hypothetical protein